MNQQSVRYTRYLVMTAFILAAAVLIAHHANMKMFDYLESTASSLTLGNGMGKETFLSVVTLATLAGLLSAVIVLALTLIL